MSNVLNLLVYPWEAKYCVAQIPMSNLQKILQKTIELNNYSHSTSCVLNVFFGSFDLSLASLTLN